MLTKGIVLAVRELAQKSETGAETRDLAAFIAIALRKVAETIDVSVAAWEKRGYWVKADRFRMEWLWAGQFAEKMKQALFANDWESIARFAVQIAQKLNKVKITTHHRLGTPWEGAWQELKNQN